MSIGLRYLNAGIEKKWFNRIYLEKQFNFFLFISWNGESVLHVEREGSFLLNGCLLCFQLTCKCSHSDRFNLWLQQCYEWKWATSHWGLCSYPGSLQSPSMWGASILRIEIAQPFPSSSFFKNFGNNKVRWWCSPCGCNF